MNSPERHSFAACVEHDGHPDSTAFMCEDLAKSGLEVADFQHRPQPQPLFNFKPNYKLVVGDWWTRRIKDNDPKYLNQPGVSPPIVLLGNFRDAPITATVEGYKKGVKFFKETGIPTICIESCWGFGESIQDAGDEVRSLHTYILTTLNPGSQHLVFMDGDWKSNEQVAAALSTYVMLLKEIGISPSCRNLPSKGVDDCLTEKYGMRGPGSQEALTALLTDAPEIPHDKLIDGSKTFTRSTAKRYNADYLDLTDRGVGSRLVKMHGTGNLLYVPQLKKFVYWNGHRWTNVGEKPVELFAPVAHYLEDRGTALMGVGYELSKASDEPTKKKAAAKIEEGKEHLKWAKRCSSSLGTGAILDFLKQKLEIVRNQTDFDATPDLLGVANGVVCLKTGKLRPEDKADLILRHCPTRYVTSHEAPAAEKVKQFLAEITGMSHGSLSPDREEYLQRRIGAALRGRNSTNSLEILFGFGANGKTVISKGVQAAIGLSQDGGYAATCSPAILLATAKPRDAEGSTPTLASLVGARMVFLPEINDTDHMNEQMVKVITGGDGLSARGNYKDPVAVEPTFTPILLTNHMPHLAEGGAAVWDRLAPFHLRCRWQRLDKIAISPEDEGLPKADLWFRDEMCKSPAALEYLLWWMVSGSVAWGESGVGKVPVDVVKVFHQYKTDEDKLLDWLAEERWELAPDLETVDSELYSSYVIWCQRTGSHAPTKKTFLKRMRDRWKSLEKRESNGRAFYMGIGSRSGK